MLPYFSRYRGLIGERFLPYCRPDQVLVSLSRSSLFDDVALAEVLASGRMAAAWFDSLEPGTLDIGRPLNLVETLQVTPQVASVTRESRRRAAWMVARRLDDLLGGDTTQSGVDDLTPTPEDETPGPAAGAASA